MSKPGDLIWRGKGMDKEMKMVYPNLVQGKYTLSPSATGYLIRKGWADSNVAVNDNSPMAYMIFRAAEAYLNYIEADYVKNGNLGCK
ncbi:RagB/SusD family nutrient uptake outer membrane protein [Bacteroides fragilis]|nr:RagB/SusD family nutrient uptake outer membrane protein [Bacteroides fragilis]